MVTFGGKFVGGGRSMFVHHLENILHRLVPLGVAGTFQPFQLAQVALLVHVHRALRRRICRRPCFPAGSISSAACIPCSPCKAAPGRSRTSTVLPPSNSKAGTSAAGGATTGGAATGGGGFGRFHHFGRLRLSAVSTLGGSTFGGSGLGFGGSGFFSFTISTAIFCSFLPRTLRAPQSKTARPPEWP